MRRPHTASVLLAFAAAVLVPKDAADARQRPEPSTTDDGLMAMVQQIFKLAMEMRMTEPDVTPIEGRLTTSVLRVKTGLAITIQLEGQPVWGYLHALFSRQKGGDEPFCDAVFLTPKESAAEFFKSAQYFPAAKSLKFASDCLLNGMGFTTSRIGRNQSPTATSETRALVHLSGFLHLFEEDQSNVRRAADFAKVGLQHWYQLLLKANQNRDLSEIKNLLGLFDEVFPVSLLTPELPLDGEGRAAARAFFQTSVQLRRKLKPFAPELSANLARDEALLLQYGGTP